MNKEALESIYEEQHDRFLEEWKTFLQFESVSTDPSYQEQCEACASWLIEHLQGMGLQTELLPTIGKPVVYASYEGKPDHPTVIFYGHYDVQPVDPVEDWDSPPFAPTLRNGRLYARGAQDNKGQAFYVIKAIETLLKHNALNCSIKMFLEGEEECGSKGITDALPKWEDKLKGDILMVCDTGAVAAGVPTVTMGLRGILHMELHLEGINHDLHSGSHGGMVKNPAMEMARLLSTLHDDNGRIAVEGFYEGVDEIHPEDRKLANEAPFSAEEYTKQIGVAPVGGEQDFTPVERKGFRPTIEVNGLHSGYGGPGGKTIVPAHAVAKLSSRLVGKQDPQHALDCILRHIKANAPEGLNLRIEDAGVGGPAVLLSSQSNVIQQAKGVLEQLSEHNPVFSWEGGSIPVVASLAAKAGAEPLLVGFGLEEDRIHAPNESFALSQFKLGFLYAALMLQQL